MRAHIFVDAENISPLLFSESYADLKTKYIISSIDVFSKEETLPHKYNKYKFNFVKCFYGKNSADTFMTSYIVKSVYEEALTDIFIIITQDNDLSPAIKMVTDNKKQAILITNKGRELKNLEEIGVNKKYFTHLEYDVVSKNKYILAQLPKNGLENFSEYDLTKTIFIKYNGHITEIFFNDGMNYKKFLNSIRPDTMKQIRKGYSKSTKLLKILYKNYLVVKNDRIYVDTDRILEDYL